MGTRSGRTIADTNINDRVVTEVLVSADDGVALLIFKAHTRAACWGGVEAVEVLDSRDDGLGGVMRVDLDPHRDARTVLVGILDQLELDRAGDGGLVILGRNKFHDAGVATH